MTKEQEEEEERKRLEEEAAEEARRKEEEEKLRRAQDQAMELLPVHSVAVPEKRLQEVLDKWRLELLEFVLVCKENEERSAKKMFEDEKVCVFFV